MAADKEDGEMWKVHSLMSGYRDNLIPESHPLFVSSVTAEYKGNNCSLSLRMKEITAKSDGNQTYRNINSGNDVSWLSGFITSAGNGECGDEDDYWADDCENCGFNNGQCGCNECHDCGSYVRGGGANDEEQITMQIEGQLKRTYNNPLFIQQVRRYVWSNG